MSVRPVSDLRQALMAMGYREVSAGKWFKPVGWHLFSYEEDRSEWTDWFKGNQGQFLRWGVKVFRHDQPDLSYLAQIKDAETWQSSLHTVSSHSEFEFRD